MPGLEPADETDGVAKFDGRSIALTGARAVTLDLDRMQVGSGGTGHVQTDKPLALTLKRAGETQTVNLPAGSSDVPIG